MAVATEFDELDLSWATPTVPTNALVSRYETRYRTVTLTTGSSTNLTAAGGTQIKLTITNNSATWYVKQTSPSEDTCPTTAIPANTKTITLDLPILTTSATYTYKAYSNSGCSTEVGSVTFTVSPTSTWTSATAICIYNCASKTSHTITGLATDTTYDVQVRAKNSHGYGPWSTTTSAKTTNGKPGAPSQVDVPSANIERQKLKVTWTPASEPSKPKVTGFHIRHKKTAETNWSALTILSDTARSYTLTGLTANTRYDIQVRAVNKEYGNGKWASATGTTASS